MATSGLYGNSSESIGLYGNTNVFGGTYFQWFIFQQNNDQPVTPTGGTWDFTTNTGTPPTGWTTVVASVAVNPVWFSTGFVDSRNPTVIVWSVPSLLTSSNSIYATAYSQTFTGNGTQTAFTLTSSPVTVNNTDVSINGVVQVPGVDYTVNSVTLTTTTPVINGAVMLVKYKQSLPNSYYGAASNVQFTPVGALTSTNVQSAIAEVVTDLALSSGSSTVGYLSAGTNAVATTVQTKLRESVSVFDFMTAAQIADCRTTSPTLDCTTAINAAITYAKTFYQNGQSPYSTGAFTQAVATLVFPTGKYLYAGTMDFTNVYSYCNLHFVGSTILHTGTGANVICINVGDGSTVDIMQMKITGVVTLARGSRDSGSVGIKNNGANDGLINGCVNIWGFETGLLHIGSEVVNYNFQQGAIGNATWAIKIQALASWAANIVSISHLFIWGGGGSNTTGTGVFVDYTAVRSGVGGDISLDSVLMQGISTTGQCVILENVGEVAGNDTFAVNHCWFENNCESVFDISNSRLSVRNSFITRSTNATPGYIVKLRDTTSTVSIEDTNCFFDDNGPLVNNAIIQRLDGTTNSLSNQISTARFKIGNGGPTLTARLTNVVAPIQSTNQQPASFQQVQFSFAAPKYPSTIADEYCTNLVLNLTTLVSDMIGSTYTNMTGYIDVVLTGSDGGGTVGKGWFRAWFKGANINWTALETSATTAYALTPSGSGTSYVVTFPATSQPAWFRTWATLTITAS